MSQWFDHPAVQAGVVPFVVGLVAALLRGRIAWFGPTLGYAASVALASGIAFVPLTAGRKVLLLALLAPLAGALVDRFDGRPARAAACLLAGAAAAWAFVTVLGQRPGGAALAAGLGLAAFVAAACALALRLRDDAPAAAASGLGLGLGSGIAALLSASSGYFGAGVAVAAACGALLAVQFATGRGARPGALGTLGPTLPAALFAAAALMLAQLPWYALPLLLAVPALAAVPLPDGLGARARLTVRTAVAVVSAALPVLAAWVATRTVSP